MTETPVVHQATLPNVPVCWSAPVDPKELEDRLENLTEWVSWVVWRYALDPRTIPPCWLQHGALVEELSALQTAWGAAFAVTSAADRPLRWQEHFALGRERLAHWVARSGCRPGAHRPDQREVPTQWA